jgi:UPF0716 family protein affecting phage T7 exclusion
MIILAILLFPIVEILVFIKFVQAYSFLDACLALMTSAFVGLLIMKMQGQVIFTKIQSQLIQGKIPDNQTLHNAFVLLGGLLIFIPGFVSDILGVLCILPGSRHLLIFYFKNSLMQGLSKGSIKVFGRVNRTEAYQERDAQVIDIEPLKVVHENKKNDL